MRGEMHDAVLGQFAALAHRFHLALGGVGAEAHLTHIGADVAGSGACLRTCDTFANPPRVSVGVRSSRLLVFAEPLDEDVDQRPDLPWRGASRRPHDIDASFWSREVG